MKSITFEKILGFVLVLSAFYSMDFSSWNGGSIFVILNLAGVSNILRDAESEFYRKLSYVFRKTAFYISLVLLIKIILIG